MPLHDYICSCGTKETRFCKMADLELPQLCQCGANMQRRVCAPMIQGDYPPYQSPIDGREISGRAARREDLLRNNCVEYEPSLKDHQMRAKAASEEKLESGVEETLNEQIVKMPSRKREILEQEIRAGADVDYQRATA